MPAGDRDAEEDPQVVVPPAGRPGAAVLAGQRHPEAAGVARAALAERQFRTVGGVSSEAVPATEARQGDAAAHADHVGGRTAGAAESAAQGMTSPGAVLVHGLWHGAWCWDEVRAGLADRGVDSVAVELPLTDLPTDVSATREALEEFGRPAVLVGHSYGGAVITAAGAHPLVRQLLYVAAFQLDEGESVSRTRPGRDLPDTRLAEAMVVSGDEVLLDPDLGPRLLYSDVPGDVAAAAAARLRPVSRPVFRGVPETIAWRTVPSTYVVCATDQVVHPDLQRAMAGRATRTLEWPCGHSPQAGRPGAVAELIAERVRATTS